MWSNLMWIFLSLASGAGLTWVSMFGDPRIWGPRLVFITIALVLMMLFFLSMAVLGFLRNHRNYGPMLRIIVGQDGPYVETENHNVYNVMKTVYIGVRNTGGVYLTNCKLEFETHDNGRELKTWHVDGPFSLNPGEQRYISLAAYGEPISVNVQGTPSIQLSAPPSGNYMGQLAPTLPLTGGVVTLRARSAESQPCEVLCKLWVDNGKLCWDEV
ncbi:hypothetical protein FHW67_003260 [Herbaspirillum sp. Sphag1AN]|uniref:hypothetical protein n=1 Tax=unclassified Herbaspirillum TaxID=2624150 RepID=UPI001615EC18|nr:MULTISPECIES: hypothetical protein [unclassified Herbaspirillum]MBB3213954.1 hypothetical protein [Herbaspirillum sp. Sphag1AN]MBB3247151.1 hypothetical protein [Herbaspirillum sp. Sphag64]